ncbi:PP2C family protein-serine/threonine phosphatase [Streptomyces sp. NPDC051569]|uniref:PP2C family protein-serine/threonine phosphatase n=1 Tax=Streptomyces sp. NPDC051569 TaxID=3365661 RepID=UPI0037986B67
MRRGGGAGNVCSVGPQPRAQLIPVGVVALAVLMDLVTPTEVTFAPLLLVAPVVAAPLLPPALIALVGLTAMTFHAFLTYLDGTFGWQSGLASQLSIAAVTALAIGINRAFQLRDTKTLRAREVAAVAQGAVLPTPPSSLGSLRIAARYVPAEDEALIGGDLYVVQDTPHGTRLMVGDVRGKGLGAVAAVSVDIGAFRYAADEAPDLHHLVHSLELALLREGERRANVDEQEGFTTALIVEFPPDQDIVRVVNRGHPPPLLLGARGTVTPLEPSEEAPPLGMTTLGTWASPVDTFPFPPGSTLLCYTDGITEARDATGSFYDPVDRLPRLVQHRALGKARPLTPEQILDALIHDVARHSGGIPQDDQALLALHRPAALPRETRQERPGTTTAP